MKNLKKIAVIATVVVALVLCGTMSAFAAGMVDGIEAMKDTVMNDVKKIIDAVVVPIILLVVAGFLLFNLVGFLTNRRHGEGYDKQITAIIITVVIGILVSTWYVWGPMVMGAEDADTSSATSTVAYMLGMVMR